MRTELQSLVNTIADIMDWTSFEIPGDMSRLSGTRYSNVSCSEVLDEYEGIDGFLADRGVFSYAVPNRNTLNYTTDIDLSEI